MSGVIYHGNVLEPLRVIVGLFVFHVLHVHLTVHPTANAVMIIHNKIEEISKYIKFKTQNTSKALF